MRKPFVTTLALTALMLAGCSRKAAPPPPPPPLAKMLPTLPLPPDGQTLVEQSGAGATQFILVSPASPDSVVAYYRQVLSTAPFHLVNENSAKGMTAFYAEQNGPSIWVTVEKNGTEGSQVVIAGAVQDDSTRRRLTPPGAEKPAVPPAQ